jgi:hypothetical protein
MLLDLMILSAYLARILQTLTVTQYSIFVLTARPAILTQSTQSTNAQPATKPSETAKHVLTLAA